MARRRSVRLPPRSKKWTGHHVTAIIQDAPVDNDVLRCVEVISDEQTKSDWTLDGIYLRLSLRRLLTTAIQEVAFIVAIQDTSNIGVVVPLDPLSTDGLDIANADVLMWGQLPVPPVIRTWDSTGALVGTHIDLELKTTFWHIKSKRKLRRGKHAITLTIACDVDAAVQVRSLCRAMLLG